MTLLKFSRDLKAQAETDSAELLQQVEVRTGANIPELLRPALVAALELSWLGGAQWGLQASAERVASMLPIVTDSAISQMRQTLLAGDELPDPDNPHGQ